MSNADDRQAGFYWIIIDGQEAEVAQWQEEWAVWLVTGRLEPLTDELCINLKVLSPCLVPPEQAVPGVVKLPLQQS